MPIYKYRCTSCYFEEEHIQKISFSGEMLCEKCGAASVRALTTAATHFKGVGWAKDGYKSSNGHTGDGPRVSDVHGGLMHAAKDGIGSANKFLDKLGKK